MTNIINHLKEKINERGLSIHALEKQARLKRGALQNIIYGRSRNPGIEILQPVAQVLKCSVSELIGEDTSVLSSSNKSQSGSPQADLVPWNPKLYRACFKVIEELLQKRGCSLPAHQILNYADEVYLYSIGQQKNLPEEYFAKWLINHFIERENL